MSVESCSKKRVLEENVDQKSKPGIDDFCRKKFKPIAPKPTLKKDQHQAVVLATLPVKSSYLEDNDSCKLKYNAAVDPGKQMILMSPPHMHVMSNLPVMLHPPLVAMNSCNPVPVLANYSFVIPVGCGHCNCSKAATQPAQVVCTSPPKNFCSHCHDEPCCKKDIERPSCNSCENNCDKKVCKSTADIVQNPYSKKGANAHVPILPLNASLPSNLKDILKLRPEKYKYSMLLNSRGTYSQLAEQTARQTKSTHLINCSVQTNENQLLSFSTSCGYSPTKTQSQKSVNVTSLTCPTVHTTSYEVNTSTHSRNLVLPTTTLSSKSTSVTSHIPVVSLDNACPSLSKGSNPRSQRIDEPVVSVSRHSVEKSNRSEAGKRTLNAVVNTSSIPCYTSTSSYLTSTASTLTSVSHSVSSTMLENTRKNTLQIRENTVSENVSSKKSVTQVQGGKKTLASVEFLSVSSRTVSNMSTQRSRAENTTSPAISDSYNIATQSSGNPLINSMQNTNTTMPPVPCSKSNGNINNFTTLSTQRLHHHNSQPQHDARMPFKINSGGLSSRTPKDHVASKKSSENETTESIPSQQPPNCSVQQTLCVPPTVSRTVTSKGHIPISNSTVLASSNFVSNVPNRTTSSREQRHLMTITATSTITSQCRMSERVSTVVAGVSDNVCQPGFQNTDPSPVPEQLESVALHSSSKNRRIHSRHPSEELNHNSTSGGNNQVTRNLSSITNQTPVSQRLNHQNICQHSDAGQNDRPRNFTSEPQRIQENGFSPSTTREWPQVVSHASEINIQTRSCYGENTLNMTRNDHFMADSWMSSSRPQNCLTHGQTVSNSNESCRQTEQQVSTIPRPISTNSDSRRLSASYPESTTTTIQTVPLISNLPASSRLPLNNAVPRKSKRCCLPRQESNSSLSDIAITDQHHPVEHPHHIRTCSAVSSHKASTSGSEVRVPNANQQVMGLKRLSHSLSTPLCQGTELQASQSGVSGHTLSDLTFPHQTHNHVPRSMLYNFSHVLNTQNDIPHRFPVPGSLGQHSLTNRHINHHQECNLPTPHSTPLPHQPSSRHLLVPPPPPPFGSMHRSMFMSPSPHPPELNLMSPRSLASTHMHDNLLYSPASIPRLTATPGFPERLHTSYPIHYLQEDRIDSCCSGGLRTSHSPTTNNYSSPWLLPSPSRTPAPSFLPSFPRHNSLKNFSSPQDFYGYGSNLSMNSITAQHHMPGCFSDMNIPHHSEPLHVQTETQGERDATGSSQLSPIVTPPPAAETLSRPSVSTSTESALMLPLMNRASESIVNHATRRNCLEDPVNRHAHRNTLHEPQLRLPSIRNASSDAANQILPTRQPSSEQCMGQTPITTSVNQCCDKNSEKSNCQTIPGSSTTIITATPINGRRSVQKTLQRQPPLIQQHVPSVQQHRPSGQQKTPSAQLQLAPTQSQPPHGQCQLPSAQHQPPPVQRKLPSCQPQPHVQRQLSSGQPPPVQQQLPSGQPPTSRQQLPSGQPPVGQHQLLSGQQQSNNSVSQPTNQSTSLSDSQIMSPSPPTQRSNKYLPFDEMNSNPSTSQTSSMASSPAQSLPDQPVKFNGVTLQCSRQILCESGRTVLCCWNCDFHTAEPKKMHRHQRREDKVMRCQLCNFTGHSRCQVDQHFKENHLDKDDPFTAALS